MASSKITKIVKNYSADFDRRREGLPEIISTVNGHADDIDGLDTRVTALEETNPEIPAHTSADAGKFLGVDSDGDLAFDYAPDDELPDYSISDAGKVLTVENDGTLGFETPAAGGLSEDVIADEFDQTATVIPGTVAAKNDVYSHLGYYYKAKRATTGAWNASDWQLLSEKTVESWGVFVNSNEYIDISGDLCFNLGNPTSLNAPVTVASATAAGLVNLDPAEYSEGSTTYHSYSVGDYVMYEGKLYKCIDATTGETWVAASWQETQVTDEFGGGGSPGFTPIYPASTSKTKIGEDEWGNPVYCGHSDLSNNTDVSFDCDDGYGVRFIYIINIVSYDANNGWYAETPNPANKSVVVTTTGNKITVRPMSVTQDLRYVTVIWSEEEEP